MPSSLSDIIQPMMRRTGALVVAAALLTLGACGPDPSEAVIPQQPAPYDPVVEPAPLMTRDAQLCDMLQAQKDVNSRLSSDGYADSYASEYDSLLKAGRC